MTNHESSVSEACSNGVAGQLIELGSGNWGGLPDFIPSLPLHQMFLA